MSNRPKNFKVFRSSAGLGLRALKKFKAADELLEYSGKMLRNEDLNDRPNRYLFRLNDDHLIDGSPRSNLARYINHSCSPNAQAVLSFDERQIMIEAIKQINIGDEITYDYGSEYFDEYIAPIGCRCVKCRAAKPKGKHGAVRAK